MGLALFGLMIVVPILEIAVFILVGRYIGLLPTLAGVVLTALIGSMIIRHQGTGLLAAARKSVAAGEAPVGDVLQGLALLIAGALLITPGFITDTIGFLFLVPGLRRRLAAMLVAQATRRAEARMRAAGAPTGGRPGGRSGGRPGGRAGVTIEGEWREMDPEAPSGGVDEPPPASGQGWSRKPPPGAADDSEERPPARRVGGAPLA